MKRLLANPKVALIDRTAQKIRYDDNDEAIIPCVQKLSAGEAASKRLKTNVALGVTMAKA